MKYTVLEKTDLGHVRGHNDMMKVKYTIKDEDEQQLCVLNWGLLPSPAVYDEELDYNTTISGVWSVSGTGYLFNRDGESMHRVIGHLLKYNMQDPRLSIDHINGYKLDNRAKNLRIASASEQNSNRESRSDKLKPCAELIAAGVEELPRYVRWDKTEKKFIIEKHPFLISEVERNIRNKAMMSGSKSAAITVIEKYQDIMARLSEMNLAVLNETDTGFAKLRENNKKEYEEIVKCISDYENGATTTVPVPEENEHDEAVPVAAPLAPLVPQRRTIAGRKKVSTLPPGCCVDPGSIPKYCYYRAKTETRGDKFVIDRHPNLVETGKKTWSTSESANLTTLRKFELLMEKYNAITS